MWPRCRMRFICMDYWRNRRRRSSSVWLRRIHKCKDAWCWNDHFFAFQLRATLWFASMNHPWNRSPPLSLPAATTCNGDQWSGWKIIRPSQYPTKPICFGCGTCKTLPPQWIATIQRKLPGKHQFSGNLEVDIIILMELNQAWISKQISHPSYKIYNSRKMGSIYRYHHRDFQILMYNCS